MAFGRGKDIFERLVWAGQSIPVLPCLLILVLLNVALLSANPFSKVDPDGLPAARTWVWWATKDYSQRQPQPSIVLLGSSLMMHPLWHQEAAYRQKDVDIAVDHESTYLKDAIKRELPSFAGTCFNFAMPGSMVSDDCMVVRALMKNDRTPSVVVIGLGPRDLVDNSFNCAASSRVYHYLERFTDTSELVELSMPQAWQRSDYYLRNLVYWKGNKHALQIVSSEFIKDIAAPLLQALPESPLNRTTDEDRRFASHKDEIEKGKWVCHPTSPYYYYDDSADCKRRYRTPNDSLFTNQLAWLELCLQTCKQRNIQAVIANVPVTPQAMAIIPPGVYDRHVSALQKLCSKYGAVFADLNVPNTFAAEDFTDTCHMDASGGKKFLDLLARFIGNNETVTAKLNAGQKMIAGKRAEGI